MDPINFRTKIHEISVLDAKRNLNVIIFNASRRRMAFECVHFRVFFMDPSNFWFKIHEISTLGAKCYLDVVERAPDMKIRTFRKVLP